MNTATTGPVIRPSPAARLDWKGGFFLLLLGLWSLWHAAAAIEISVYPPVPRPGSVIRLEVRGEWPNSCLPELERATIEAGRFRIFAKAFGIDCKPVATPFHLETVIGHWIYTLMAVSGFYPVEFLVRTQPQTPPHLFAFTVIRADRNTQMRLVPENGFWWVDDQGLYGQAGRGSGINIDRQGDQMIVTLQTYNAAGQPVWYFAEGTLSHGVFQADYHQIAGGSPLYAVGNSPREIHKVGRLILTFDNQRKGTLWLLPELTHLPEQGMSVFPVSIRRYLTSSSKPTEALRGDWLLSAAVTPAASAKADTRLQFTAGRFINDSRDRMEFVAADKRLLRCVVGADKALQQCTLLSPQGRQLVLFEDVGLERLRGIDLATGKVVSLLRLD
jgi:hypothetical protein